MTFSADEYCESKDHLSSGKRFKSSHVKSNIESKTHFSDLHNMDTIADTFYFFLYGFMNFYTFWPNTKACFDQIWPSIATGISFSMISVVVTRHISSRTANKQKTSERTWKPLSPWRGYWGELSEINFILSF